MQNENRPRHLHTSSTSNVTHCLTATGVTVSAGMAQSRLPRLCRVDGEFRFCIVNDVERCSLPCLKVSYYHRIFQKSMNGENIENIILVKQPPAQVE